MLWLYITSLVDIYNALHPKGGFEVVFIGLKYGKYASKPKKLCKSFEEMLSIMPWTAIPDIKSPRYWERKLRFPLSGSIGVYDPCSFVIDPTGVLLSWRADVYFARYGAEAFPFTEDKIDFLESQDEEAFKHPSITALLTSPESDYVINNKGQVKLSQLLGKRIILIVDGFMCSATPEFWQELRARYLQLKDTDAEFEVIHIHMKEGPSYDGKHFGATMSWLRHPRFHEESHITKLFFRVFRNHVGLLAFDCDGRVVRRTLFPSIEREIMDFPFHFGGLEEVALADLVKRYEWDFWLD